METRGFEPLTLWLQTRKPPALWHAQENPGVARSEQEPISTNLDGEIWMGCWAKSVELSALQWMRFTSRFAPHRDRDDGTSTDK